MILFKCGLGVQADALPHGEGRQAGGGCGHLLRLLRGDARQAGGNILIKLPGNFYRKSILIFYMSAFIELISKASKSQLLLMMMPHV